MSNQLFTKRFQQEKKKGVVDNVKTKAKKSNDCGCYMDDEEKQNQKGINTIKTAAPSLQLDQWQNQEIVTYIQKQLFPILGKPSHVKNMSKSNSNMVVWKAPLLYLPCADAIVVRDENILHEYPSPHFDCVTVVVRLVVPASFASEVARLLPNIVIDVMKKRVMIRCGSLPLCIAQLAILVRAISTNNVKLLSQLGDWIVNAKQSDQLALMIQDICKRLRGLF